MMTYLPFRSKVDMNKLEQFIAVYEPQGDKSICFRHMLDEIISEIKNKPEHEIIGMRDYFAAHIIQGLLANNTTCDNDETVIKSAWGLADKMIKARNDS